MSTPHERIALSETLGVGYPSRKEGDVSRRLGASRRSIDTRTETGALLINVRRGLVTFRRQFLRDLLSSCSPNRAPTQPITAEVSFGHLLLQIRPLLGTDPAGGMAERGLSPYSSPLETQASSTSRRPDVDTRSIGRALSMSYQRLLSPLPIVGLASDTSEQERR